MVFQFMGLGVSKTHKQKRKKIEKTFLSSPKTHKQKRKKKLKKISSSTLVRETEKKTTG